MESEGLKFYRCNSCGNLCLVLVDPNVKPVCCGNEMEILNSNTTDDGNEKHLPVIEVGTNSVTVKVGEVPHPMETAHRIEWIALLCGSRIEIKKLGISSAPEAKFEKIETDGKLRAYAFCNIHGLWSSEQ
ncbi:desulfoferrodoxin Dfx [Candidatus Saccharibacteria bacterium]|nr:desulfoferrodoxin Dfx [Candidatus Saccharibacteria bacterium]